MNVIKTENVDVYALFEDGNLIVSVTVNGGVILTAEYPIEKLADDFIQALRDDETRCIGMDDEPNAWRTIEALETAADMINDAIED